MGECPEQRLQMGHLLLAPDSITGPSCRTTGLPNSSIPVQDPKATYGIGIGSSSFWVCWESPCSPFNQHWLPTCRTDTAEALTENLQAGFQPMPWLYAHSKSLWMLTEHPKAENLSPVPAGSARDISSH